jgi:hypothetical protein
VFAATPRRRGRSRTSPVPDATGPSTLVHIVAGRRRLDLRLEREPRSCAAQIAPAPHWFSSVLTVLMPSASRVASSFFTYSGLSGFGVADRVREPQDARGVLDHVELLVGVEQVRAERHDAVVLSSRPCRST